MIWGSKEAKKQGITPTLTLPHVGEGRERVIPASLRPCLPSAPPRSPPRRMYGAPLRACLASSICVGLFSSGILALLTPLPILYSMARNNKISALLAGLLSFLAVAAFHKGSLSEPDVYYMAYCVVTGLLLGEGLLRRWQISKWFALAVGLPWVLAVVGLIAGELGWGVTGVIKTHFFAIFDELVKMYEASAKTTLLVAHKEDIIKFMVWVLPAIIWVFGLGGGCLNAALVKRIYKDPSMFAHLGRITAWSVPQDFVWFVIACGAAFFINSYFLKNEIIKFIMINGLIIGASIYFVHGILIIAYFLEGRASFLMKLILAGLIALFIQMAGIVIVGLGFADMWVDFRRRYEKAPPSGGA